MDTPFNIGGGTFKPKTEDTLYSYNSTDVWSKSTPNVPITIAKDYKMVVATVHRVNSWPVFSYSGAGQTNYFSNSMQMPNISAGVYSMCYIFSGVKAGDSIVVGAGNGAVAIHGYN